MMCKGYFIDEGVHLKVGYLYQKIILNKDGELCDFQYIEMNQVVEKITNIQSSEIIGKKESEVKLFNDYQKNLIEKLKEVSSYCGQVQYQQEIKGDLYDINVYFINMSYFITIIKGKDHNSCIKNLENPCCMLRKILDTIPIRIFWKDLNLNYLGCNKKFAEDAGLSSPNEIIGKNDYELGWKNFAQTYRCDDREVLNTEQPKINFEEKVIGKDGEIMWVKTTKIPIYDNHNKLYGVMGTFEDITERKVIEEKMKYLSFHDHLTGLYNRRFLEEEINGLDKEINLPISIIMIDINGLKLMNDAFGHKSGDLLIQKVAEGIKQSCRKEDIIARVGGDEFIVLLPKTNAKEVEKVITSIHLGLQKKKINGINISIASGTETKTNNHQSINDLLKKAETYMYKKKTEKKTQIRNEAIISILELLFIKFSHEKSHADQVSKISADIGAAIGLEQQEINELKMLGRLHDIGKIAIDEKIVNRSLRYNNQDFTKEEILEYKRHPEVSYIILSSSNEYTIFSEDVLHHHERYDGKGYPRGLKGKEIPIKSRILALADTVDKMTSTVNNNFPLTQEEVILKLKQESGKKFDPELVKVFIEEVLN
ncbi:diguanylate cyclase [Serpentinicella sp. ANB-PHB4]|uniref:diguanylate cyclase n=1 Tax=Serpentinicella sp. ANB-PHB4 TaxID=3074076 RepID=UPI002856E9FA|nr:diguanylate cyclase [Serpentinicella sp. ANB-PHB4]MDR5659243.1 diguanylate cyclase [Serpentinicella sp. ANB-PHB4]